MEKIFHRRICLVRLSFSILIFIKQGQQFDYYSSKKNEFNLLFFSLGEQLLSTHPNSFHHRNGYFTIFNRAYTLRISKHGYITVFLKNLFLPYVTTKGYRYLHKIIISVIRPALRFRNSSLPACCRLRLLPKLEQLQMSLTICELLLPQIKLIGRENPFILAFGLHQLCESSESWSTSQPQVKFNSSDPDNEFASRGLRLTYYGRQTLIRLSPNLNQKLTAVSPNIGTLKSGLTKFLEFISFIQSENFQLHHEFQNQRASFRDFLTNKYFSFAGLK